MPTQERWQGKKGNRRRTHKGENRGAKVKEEEKGRKNSVAANSRLLGTGAGFSR